MEKLAVIGIDAAKEDLLADLMDLGVVEITEQTDALREGDIPEGVVSLDGDEDTVAGLDAEIARIGTALNLLHKHGREKQPLFITRRKIRKSEFDKVLSRRGEILENVNHLMSVNKKLRIRKEKMNKAALELKTLEAWSRYDMPLEIRETRQVRFELGVVPATVNVDDLREAVAKVSDSASIETVNRDKDMIYIFTADLKTEHGDVVTVLKQWGYTPAPFENHTGTVAENRKRFEKEIAAGRKEIKVLEADIAKCEHMKNDIECLQDQLIIERDREKIKGSFLKTEKTFKLEGWIPVECKKDVEKVLERHDCLYAYRKPKDDEEVPVLVRNSSFGTPFSAITEMYSLPDYRGFDPTDIFSIFYAMFFGMMLSDAGYGLILTVACFFILRKYDIEGLTRKMIKMFLFCGIATVFWGAMFGGWFGDFIPSFTKTVFGHKVNVGAIWFNPIDDPTKLLIFSLLFGIVHLFAGMGINAYMMIRRGNLKDAVFDVFSWYMVIVGGGLWLAGSNISAGAAPAGRVVCIVGAVIILLTGGRNNKGIGKLTGGLGSLYGVTGYISDILSYARLLALGLATGVIANVVNLLGSMIGSGVVGLIAMIVVGIIGHTFNLAINALGSFVHSSRLQYIEFFGKFYEDGGEEFSPFRNNTRYVRFTQDK